MRIHTIGLFAFLAWSSLSTYLYVCKIKGLCDAPLTMKYSQPVPEEPVAIETPAIPSEVNYALPPEEEIIYFDFDKSEIKSAGITDLYILHSNAYLEQNTDAKLSIIGFTDAIGTLDYNDALGYRRAEKVQNYFESKGIPKNKISIESMGEKLPAADNITIAGREKNRRTVIIIKN